jgi:hypothetical protein
LALERARFETEFGFCVILLALAKGAAKKKLLERNVQLEAKIEGL